MTIDSSEFYFPDKMSLYPLANDNHRSVSAIGYSKDSGFITYPTSLPIVSNYVQGLVLVEALFDQLDVCGTRDSADIMRALMDRTEQWLRSKK